MTDIKIAITLEISGLIFFKFKFSWKIKIGACHKYNEKDILPIKTRIGFEKNLYVKVSLNEKTMIKNTPKVGINVNILGCGILLSKKIWEKTTISKPIKLIKLVFLKSILLLLKVSFKYSIPATPPKQNSQNLDVRK